jgi:hypothetical protein
MRVLFAPWTLAAAGVLTIIGALASPNIAVWAACVLTLPAAVWLLGGTSSHRVLLWLIAMFWFQIIGDVISADLNGMVLSDGSLGPYQIKAVLFSLCSAVALALGMRIGTRSSRWSFRPVGWSGSGPAEHDRGIILYRAMLGYFGALLLTKGVEVFVRSIPALAQPVLALTLIKFVFIYLIAARVFKTERGYSCLLVVSSVEMVTGLTGYFSGYKEAFFIMLMALASIRRPANVREWAFGVTAVLAVVWVSLIWTASKKEYRLQVAATPIEYRIEWFARRFLVDQIDYSDATAKLFERIGYTYFFSTILARQDVGSLPEGVNYYIGALQHILTPRILFPDKERLDDSVKTTALLGITIDADTSIGVGYVAQANVDFGFPGMLVPIFLIGLMIGATARYFMDRAAPLVVREAFCTATLFLSFQFAANIDKALGGFLMGCLVMGLALKFGYPFVASWLEVSRARAFPRLIASEGIPPTGEL